MATTEQKKRLLKAKIAVALHDELGRVPKKEEIEKRVFNGKGNVQSRPGASLSEAAAEENGQLAIF